MIDQLFGSKTRVKLLQLFYNNTNRPFYVREITRTINEQINSVRRELSNLLSVGIITSVSKNNRLYYEVNQSHEHYKPLKQIFTGMSSGTVGVTKSADERQKRFRALGKVRIAYLLGSMVQDDSMDVDMLIVGDVNRNKVTKLIAEMEQEEGVQLNYSIMPINEFEYRRDLKDRFVSGILQAKKTVIIDEYAKESKK